MKKIYNKPSMLVVDVKVESIMTCCSSNIETNDTSAWVTGSKITNTANGGEADAAGYRSNLWGD